MSGDEFDIELEDVSFAIDAEDDEEDDVNLIAASDEPCPGQESSQVGNELFSPERTENELRDSREKDEGYDNISTKEIGNQLNQSIEDMEDDEMDLILSQINVDEVQKLSLVKTPYATPNRPSSARPQCQTTPSRFKAALLSAHPVSVSPNLSESKNYAHVTDTLNKKSPGKRSLADSEAVSFFLSQSNRDVDVSPAKRSFPGPAGILPSLDTRRLKSWKNLKLAQSKKEVVHVVGVHESKSSEKLSMGNLTLKVRPLPKDEDEQKPSLSKAPWKRMLQHFNLSSGDANGLLNVVNIEWIKSNDSELSADVTIPFLAAVVRDDHDLQLQRTEKQPSQTLQKGEFIQTLITLMDPTGTVTAMLSPSFVEAFGKLIHPGAALILRNCHPTIWFKQPYLAITRKNVVCLVTNKTDHAEKDDESENEFPQPASDNDTLLREYFSFSADEVMDEFANLVNRLANGKSLRRPDTDSNRAPLNSNQQPQLFSHISNKDSKPSEFETNDDFGDDDDDELFIKALQNYEICISEPNNVNADE